MRRNVSILGIAALGFLLVSCAAEAGPTFTDADRAAIEAATEEALAINATQDHQAYVDHYYTADAIVLPPNGEAIRGREALLAFNESFPPYESLQFSHVEMDGAGDMAYVYGTYTMVMAAAEGEEPAEDHGKYIEIWKRQADGSWKVALDIFNSDLPLPEMEVAPEMGG
jgi:ketosteroid isomerase-like protein